MNEIDEIRARAGTVGTAPQIYRQADAVLMHGDIHVLLAVIDRLNARIEAMHAERMEMIARTNEELDKLRDALAEREEAAAFRLDEE